MLIGAMNHPRRSLQEQIEWLGKNQFEFLDLTLEPPCAASWSIDVKAVKEMLAANRLRVVGHTAPFLPIANPVEGVRRAAVDEMLRCMDVFHALGAQWMNLHPRTAPMHDRAFTVEQNVKSLRTLIDHGKRLGLGVMIENVPGSFNTAREMGDLLDAIPELGLHLDLAHANLMVPVNTTKEILDAYGDRLRHVHLHDNRGGHLDLHLPLGAGDIDLPELLRLLKATGYDGTITLEVFATNSNLLLESRRLLREIWDACGERTRSRSVAH